MANGISMGTALRQAAQQPVEAATARAADGPFLCDGCRVSVSLVPRHTRHIGDPERERTVSAFFRLLPRRPPAKPVVHAVGCRYTTTGQLQELVRQSTAVEAHFRPFVAEDGVQTFRLAMLDDAIKGIGWTEDKEEYRRRVERVLSSRTLEQYFRSAAGLAKLWVLLGEMGGRRELRDLVRIKMRNGVVPWSRFFFEADDAPKLAAMIKKDGLLKHPSALVVYVRQVADLREGERGVARCSCVLADAGPPRVYTGASVFGPVDAMQGFREGRHYVVVGSWRRDHDTQREAEAPGRHPAASPRTPPITFQNLSVSVHQAAQYAEVDPPEDP